MTLTCVGDNESLLDDGDAECLTASLNRSSDRNYCGKDDERTREIIDMKLQIAIQNEKLDTLSNTLSRYQIENEALKAEVRELHIDIEATTARDALLGQAISSHPAKGRFSFRRLVSGDYTRSMQVSVENVRASFKSCIKFSLNSSGLEKTIEALQKEIDYLRKQQEDPSAPLKERSSKGDTATTNVESLDPVSEKLDEAQGVGSSSFAMTNSVSLDPVDENLDEVQVVGLSGSTSEHDIKKLVSSSEMLSCAVISGLLDTVEDCWCIEGIDIEAGATVKENRAKKIKAAKNTSRRGPEKSGLLVDFGGRGPLKKRTK